MQINQDSNTFNNLQDISNSHIVISKVSSNSANIKLKDSNSKIIFSFGEKFRLNENYDFTKLFIDNDSQKYNLTYADGSKVSNLFSHLSTISPIIELQQTSCKDSTLGCFRASINGTNGIANTITLNNTQTMINLSLWTRKNVFAKNHNHSHKLTQTTSKNLTSSPRLMTANYIINDNEPMFYNVAQNPQKQNRRNKRNYNLAPTNPQQNIPQNLNKTQSSKDSSVESNFFFTPFISYNNIYQNDLSGLNYGFITGISGNLGKINTLGTHIGFSYGGVGNKKSHFDLSTMSVLLGLHYNVDLVYDMYVRVFGDFYYFLNDLKYKRFGGYDYDNNANNFAFGASAYYGKNFDFKKSGNLSLEVGLEYKGNSSAKMDFTHITNGEIYQASLANLLYADLRLEYQYRLNDFGLKVGGGGKVLAFKPRAKVETMSSTYDYEMDLDRFFGDINAGVSYKVHKSVDLGLDYMGIFGDKSMSNAGFFSVRVWW